MSSRTVTRRQGRPGVYKITNPLGLIYIGASMDVHDRIHTGYKIKVKKKRAITDSIDKYGHENHHFEVVEYCNIEDLNERERHYQEYFNSLSPNGLNQTLVACRGKKQVLSQATKNKLRESGIGHVAWNVGIPLRESTKKKRKDGYHPFQRPTSMIILDTRTGVYYYNIGEAAEVLGMTKAMMRRNLLAPSCECRKNKTQFIKV